MIATVLTESHDTPADFWQEFPRLVPKEPLPPARLEDDYYALMRCGFSHFEIIPILRVWHAMSPAEVWLRLRPLQPEETDHMLPVIRFFESSHRTFSYSLRRCLWRLVDSALSILAFLEDCLRHHTTMPPGWHQ